MVSRRAITRFLSADAIDHIRISNREALNFFGSQQPLGVFESPLLNRLKAFLLSIERIRLTAVLNAVRSSAFSSDKMLFWNFFISSFMKRSIDVLYFKWLE